MDDLTKLNKACSDSGSRLSELMRKHSVEMMTAELSFLAAMPKKKLTRWQKFKNRMRNRFTYAIYDDYGDGFESFRIWRFHFRTNS
jgi:hypothetical protein